MIMKHILSHRFHFVLFVLAASFLDSSMARGDAATDILVSSDGAKLSTSASLYVGAFDPASLYTSDPGFAGSPPTGTSYAVNILGKLWYHSGIDGDPVTVAAGDPSVRITSLAAPQPVVLSQSSLGVSSLMLTGNLSGSLHDHLGFLLQAGSSPAPLGVYGLVMQITSPSLQASQPFLLALANIGTGAGALDLAGVEYGEQALFAAAVPEPSSVALAGLGVVGLVGTALRRRIRTRRAAG